MRNHTHKRRTFLKTAGAALSLPLVAKSTLFGANDRVKVGIIGTGGRAGGIFRSAQHVNEMQVTAVCDCFVPKLNRYNNSFGKGQNWNIYTDFRKMIEKEKLEGVMVETTTHARAWVTILAMQMGCDTYIEKPMCLTIAEGRYMVKAARKYKTVTQVGTQQRSILLNNQASDLVRTGGIGKVHTVLAPDFVGPVKWTDQPGQKMPDGGSDNWWDIWTNQAEMRPYHPQLQHGWAKWWAYDGGGLCFGVTGWGTHSYDQVNRGLGTNETGPVELVLEEPVKDRRTGSFTKPADKDDTGIPYHGMAKHVVGPRAKATMTFASGTKLKLNLDGDHGPGLGCIFVGEKGSVSINRNLVSSDPPELTEGLNRSAPGAGNGTGLHIRNWVQCIKSRKPANADIEYGQRSSTLCYLLNIIREVGQVGKKIKWDPEKERFTNCDEGNKLVDRARRKGWELPPLT